jgi:hypothetical protein
MLHEAPGEAPVEALDRKHRLTLKRAHGKPEPGREWLKRPPRPLPMPSA